MAKESVTKTSTEFTASDFSTLNAHADGVIDNEKQLARLKKFRADRVLIKNFAIIALILGVLAILLAIAYNRAYAPIIDIVEKNHYDEGLEFISEYFKEEWPFDNKFFLIINQAVGGFWPGDPDVHFTKSQFIIDWIKVYQ